MDAPLRREERVVTTTEQPVHPVADGIEIHGSLPQQWAAILSPDALSFVATLHRQLNATRLDLLARRRDRQADFDSGALPDFLPETQSVRDSDWQVAPCPDDLQKRWVEITGPCERKMMINALNSGADAFMSDLEDSLAPTWENVVEGQINLHDAVRKEISFENPDGRRYELKDEIATLLVRPRGWHLNEKHLLIDGEPCSASLFDFGLYMFHNATERLSRGTGPYFYLAKLESHLEARLWNDAFNLAQDELGIPRGSARVTVLIETITAAYEMDEILYELRDHISGLNAGRWDYIFSVIKRFRNRADFLLPDRSQISMTVPFMRAYTELLVKTCHRRGAHAMGGMSAFIPNRRDPELNERAMAAVRDDKHRESTDGFDGTWIAHPDLGPVAREEFGKALGDKPNQRERQRDDVVANAAALANVPETGGSISEEGVRLNVSVALQYLNQWLNGNGAAAINNLMEDAATAEISRAQLWQWLRHNAELTDGRSLTRELYQQIRVEELGELGGANAERYGEAAEILDGLVLEDEFVDFLTLPAYEHLT
jgi:malate synthase